MWLSVWAFHCMCPHLSPQCSPASFIFCCVFPYRVHHRVAALDYKWCCKTQEKMIRVCVCIKAVGRTPQSCSEDDFNDVVLQYGGGMGCYSLPVVAYCIKSDIISKEGEGNITCTKSMCTSISFHTNVKSLFSSPKPHSSHTCSPEIHSDPSMSPRLDVSHCITSISASH